MDFFLLEPPHGWDCLEDDTSHEQQAVNHRVRHKKRRLQSMEDSLPEDKPTRSSGKIIVTGAGSDMHIGE